MADKKISALTGASTPLAGTEVLPIVQGGATVKVAVSNLTAGRDVSVAALSATGVATFSAGTALLPALTTTGDTNTGIFFPAADTIAFAEGGTEAMRLNSSAIMLMGATSARTTEAKIELTSPANTALSLYMFKDTQVEATLGFKSSTDSNFYVGSGSTSVGTNGVYLTNLGTAWIAVSDERLKKDITPLDTNRGLSSLLKINPVTFYWKSENSQPSLQIGLVAQNVQENFPDLVSMGPASEAAPDGAIGVNYTGFIAPLIKAIQELKVIIDTQADRIAALEAKV
jgi:hypothetical protein